jgi:hypothetical protein
MKFILESLRLIRMLAKITVSHDWAIFAKLV